MAASRSYLYPAMFFAAGAIIGRIVGLKNLTKGAVAAASFAGAGPKFVVDTADQLINGKVHSKPKRRVRAPAMAARRRTATKTAKAA